MKISADEWYKNTHIEELDNLERWWELMAEPWETEEEIINNIASQQILLASHHLGVELDKDEIAKWISDTINTIREKVIPIEVFLGLSTKAAQQYINEHSHRRLTFFDEEVSFREGIFKVHYNRFFDHYKIDDDRWEE